MIYSSVEFGLLSVAFCSLARGEIVVRLAAVASSLSLLSVTCFWVSRGAEHSTDAFLFGDSRRVFLICPVFVPIRLARSPTRFSSLSPFPFRSRFAPRSRSSLSSADHTNVASSGLVLFPLRIVIVRVSGFTSAFSEF